MRTDQIFVRSVEALDERGRHAVLSGPNEDGLGTDGSGTSTIGANALLGVGDQSDPLSIDRQIDILERFVVARGEHHAKHVFAVCWEYT